MKVLAVLCLLLVACKHEDRNEPQQAEAAFSLSVSIGQEHETWTRETFSSVKRTFALNKSGESRDAWSLRAIAKELVGPTARVAKVIGPSGAKVIDANAWADLTRSPIVHVTRRGSLKFRWAASDGTWGETEVNDVSALEILVAP
jgi:hypothetical protein